MSDASRPNLRPCRTVLSVPGVNARAMEKARSLAADALMFDLEDSVPPDRKDEARGAIVDQLSAGGYGAREILIRVNGLDTAWAADDLKAAVSVGVDGVVLPKIESAADITQAESALDAAGAAGSLAIWAMIETPRAVLSAADIAATGNRVAMLVVGGADLTKDLHARHTPDRAPLMTALGMTVLAARAHGIGAIDSPHFDLDDAAGFEASCRQGVSMGFDGKMVLHPKTIEAANAIYGPSVAEINQARAVINAHAEARAAGSDVTLLDGKLVEALHVADAERLIALADRINKLGSAD